MDEADVPSTRTLPASSVRWQRSNQGPTPSILMNPERERSVGIQHRGLGTEDQPLNGSNPYLFPAPTNPNSSLNLIKILFKKNIIKYLRFDYW